MSIFENKEQYLAFRAKWKELHAAGYHKAVPVAQTTMEYIGGKWEYPVVGYHKVSPLSAWYHLIFNIAIGRNPPTKAFVNTPGNRNGNYDLWADLWPRDFVIFGDALTPEQQKSLSVQAEQYRQSL